MPSNSQLFIGLMSGTSLDGVDGVLASFTESYSGMRTTMLGAAYVPFPAELKSDLMDLQASGADEIHREAVAANALMRHYAQCVARLTSQARQDIGNITAIGMHGQTTRHRPDSGYTRQTGNPALLAELTGIDVVADFRSRDIAAGGQGAPLVPAFHQAVFSNAGETRVVVNIGGISNISILTGTPDAPVTGFDTGPGNVLLDAWTARHLGEEYDANGKWAATGTVLFDLLRELHDEPFFFQPPPKSTGRDLFHEGWLAGKLQRFESARPADVQATLTAFTAGTIADAIAAHAPSAKAVYVCGGGAYNSTLLNLLGHALSERKMTAIVESTETLGVSPNHVEALAFAWLTYRFSHRQPGNLPSVTGANGPRILGALYPA